MAREVTLRQLAERLVAIERSRPGNPLVEERERGLLALMSPVTDQTGLRVVGQDVQSSYLPRVERAASLELNSGSLQ